MKPQDLFTEGELIFSQTIPTFKNHDDSDDEDDCYGLDIRFCNDYTMHGTEMLNMISTILTVFKSLSFFPLFCRIDETFQQSLFLCSLGPSRYVTFL